jgi:SAM-dependent methyltransferase
MTWGETEGHCTRCGRPARRWHGRIPDLLDEGESNRRAAAILDWPDEALPRVERGLRDLQEGRAPADDDRVELEARGLIAEGRLTALGRKVTYHLVEHHRQAGDDFIAAEVLDRAGLGDGAHVLDVGGGAGQSLRQLAPRRPAERVGLDHDLEALALGGRMADAAGEDIRFIRASAYALPFPDGRFTHVLSRVALNYMHQRLALEEMARVLRPGGVLYGRIAGLGQDLTQLADARDVRTVLRHLRDLGLGVVLELTGRQAMPGGRYTGDYAFATARRVGRALRHAGCEPVYVAVTQRRGGLPRSVEILARRHDHGPR